ncbi:MAG: hypothetical protein KF725_03655 [Cyclobacteriaceae bacterium]|nr:hypothetical protein [Cyclobacteriaceae bacterium]UYN85614.1 MAG: hypothetical protein KIT51_12080 [Cyclobacteriaceae bacterium]
MVRLLLIGWILTCIGSGAHAQEYGHEVWSRFTFGVMHSNTFKQDFEVQYRDQQSNAFVESRFKLYTFRWYLVFSKHNTFIQLSPFTFFYRDPEDGEEVKEFRFAQFVGRNFFSKRFQIRTGLEERFFTVSDQQFEELRWRTRLGFMMEVFANIHMNISNEFFVRDRLTGVEVNWFDQNRINVSFPWKIAAWTLEPGYSFQTRQISKSDIDNFNVVYLNINYQHKKRTET